MVASGGGSIGDTGAKGLGIGGGVYWPGGKNEEVIDAVAGDGGHRHVEAGYRGGRG